MKFHMRYVIYIRYIFTFTFLIIRIQKRLLSHEKSRFLTLYFHVKNAKTKILLPKSLNYNRSCLCNELIIIASLFLIFTR